MSAVATAGIIEGARPRTYQAGAANMLRGTAVVQGADDVHVVPAGANAGAFGIIGESVPNIGDALSITRLGEAYAIAGAAVNANQFLITNAAGQLVPSTATSDRIVGYAVTSAALAGDQFIVFILPSIR